jgi:hypothetical protein
LKCLFKNLLTVLLVLLGSASIATSTVSHDTLFQGVWGHFWFRKIPINACYESIKNTNKRTGLYAKYLDVDVSYQVLVNNSMPEVDIRVPARWNQRAGKTAWQGRVHMPSHFIIPDANQEETPNNPTIIYNTDTRKALFLNAAARPYANGPVWAYKSDSKPCTHGGSGLTGGEVTLKELQESRINHAIGIVVWGRKYLNATKGGYVSPATKADDHYNNPKSDNYYGSRLNNLKMGSWLGIRSSITEKKLGITSAVGKTVYKALKTHGAYIVDNSAWDAIYIEATPDASPLIKSNKDELSKIFGALELIKE